MFDISYNELNELSKEYYKAFQALYRLNTKEQDEIEDIYKGIKKQFIDTKMFLPRQFPEIIRTAAKYNIKYLKSYYLIFKKFCYEYNVASYYSLQEYYFYKIQGSSFNPSLEERFIANLICKFFTYIPTNRVKVDEFPSKSNILDIHEENSIHSAIMDDDKELFISFTLREGFNMKQRFDSEIYPNNSNSLLELCCYYGAVGCFKYLRDEFKFRITDQCLCYSFLSGKPYIMSECLKYRKPKEECMKYAIISHNTDFVSFLMNEYKLKINLEDCIKFNNIQAFLIYIADKNMNMDAVIKSMKFQFPLLCEYFLSRCVLGQIYSTFINDCFREAVQCECKKIVEILILHGANVNNSYSPLSYAAGKNNTEIAELLISHGALVNAIDEFETHLLHEATRNNCTETAKTLLENGAHVNAKDVFGMTPLHIAAKSDCTETAELLLSYGANVKAKDNYGNTPFFYAISNDCIETAKIVCPHKYMKCCLIL
ncbi:hypothetical protein TVAG_239980 [Trichomonas vaginalis G3]|uniref:DUF3447 domain-containing protein n=1 Tax=Trichomonas vaginalis (strain ATCC PRA-98 / G3) TaxID=412133 RepID=A2EFE1_TRIV3|nr:spectrin binding [Trichomonas vaginalis G3]EAY08638.1 hypothetical protein TVAG_239980 [Trichomonas vaginalis G3]KAI5543841.1 spectrin binding [Trichomonas vaginalis G3]|eukprot:XP_001320861.1 hypothetical protein [Trichomonas vaginalis G3]